MKITVLSGGIGGATFVQGLLDVVESDAEITVVGNTADDLWLHGLKVCPDLDTLMYTLGGGIDPERRWGRAEETWSVSAELEAYGAEPSWFGLGDRDIATHLVRTQMLQAGYRLGDVTRALCVRWDPGVRLLPMSDDRVESHVVIDDESAPSGQRAIHFQEYWVRLRAQVPARDVVVVGIDEAKPAPGVVDAITGADVVILPPSNPVVSVGPILAVPGLGDAVRTTEAPVVGVSPIIGGGAVRGMADQLLTGLGVEVSAAGVARRFGTRAEGGILDGWLVDEADRACVDALADEGLTTRAVPLYMSDRATTAQLARDTLSLADAVRR